MQTWGITGDINTNNVNAGMMTRELNVPVELQQTPGTMRGGGAVAQFNPDEDIPLLLWKMRLQSTKTLEHDLQEVTARTNLTRSTDHARA